VKRAYAKKEPGRKPKPSQRRAKNQDKSRQIQLRLDRDELLTLMQDSLESLAVEIGLLVAFDILEDEVSRLCGARYQHQGDLAPSRPSAASWHSESHDDAEDFFASGRLTSAGS
jgi:hypothetical protein